MMPEIEHVLEENNYEYCLYNGCFDIAANKANNLTENILLLKVLENVDSFLEDQAANLSAISNNINANALLVGKKTRVEKLQNSIVYERFNIPTVNIHTLEMILEGNIPYIFRTRGGLFSEINPEKLKNARKAAGLSQKGLADEIGISKKSVYEHESKRMRAELQIVEKLEQFLDESVSEPVSLNTSNADIQPKGNFEKTVSGYLNKIGFSTNFVYKSPFNIIASSDNVHGRGSVDSFLLISDAEEQAEKAKKKAPKMAEFISVVNKPGIVVTKDEINLDIPAVTEKQLKEMNLRDLKKLIK